MKNNKLALLVSLFILGGLGSAAHADLIPGGNGSDLYYNFGGGNPAPLPPVANNNRIPLYAKGAAGLGYNCGVFNPQMSLIDSLNSVKSSYQEMVGSILQNATGALTEMPAYAIARADPNLYQQLQSSLFNARQDLEVSTKSCEQVSNEIDAGKDPYDGWLKASLGDTWKYKMNMASSSSLNSGYLGAANGDINQAKTAVDQDNGASGVVWVQGTSKSDGSKYAGGRGQPEILLINDTVLAGYNILIDPQNRAYDDKAAPPGPGPQNNSPTAGITSIFPAPKDAADWATHVLGDEIITTYPGGRKTSSPGVGLLWDVQAQATQVQQDLTDLVTGVSDMTLTNLKAVSAPRVMINQAVIKTIQQQTSSIMQSIIIQKLSTEVASARVIDKAELTLQLLMVGEQAPPIYANQPAQTAITSAMTRLKDYISQFMFNNDVNQQFVSKTVTQILQETANEQAANAAIRPDQNTPAVMNNGAIQSGA